MKYLADSLSLFVFHDAVFSLTAFEGDTLQLDASRVNIHKRTEQNPADHDMVIDEAAITFTGFRLLSYKLLGGKIYDEQWNLVREEETVCYSDQNALREFTKQAKKGFDVMGITELSDHIFCLTSSSTVFEIEFTFSSVKIEWDTYAGKAWYEK